MALIYGLKKFLRSLISYFYHWVGFIIGETRAKEIKFLILRVIKGFRPRNTIRADVLRLARRVETGERLKLHFGADTRILKGWVNIDITPYREPREYSFPDLPELRGSREDFFQIDFREGSLPLPDSSVELIFHEDFIEHLTQKETVLFLAETWRILKVGGAHRINTPNLIGSMKRHSNCRNGLSGVYVSEWERYGHENILTPSYLKELAEIVGYREVLFTGKNKSRFAGMPEEFRPSEEREDPEQIFCDLIK